MLTGKLYIGLCAMLRFMMTDDGGGGGVSGGVLALKCICNPDDCEVIRSLDCPGKGIILWDPCK